MLDMELQVSTSFLYTFGSLITVHTFTMMCMAIISPMLIVFINVRSFTFFCCSFSKRQYYYNKSYCNFLLPISVGICQYFVVEWQDAIGVKILLKVQFLVLPLDLVLGPT